MVVESLSEDGRGGAEGGDRALSPEAHASPGPKAADWLVGGGEMGELIRSLDWSKTPLGPIESWPQSLRSAVSILLPSKAQIALFWGRDLITLYNDAYRPALGAKHPRALGQPVQEVWSELWEAGLKELFEGVLTTGEAFWASDWPFFMERYGFPEETFFDISYDPVRDETGRVGGLFCIVSETTARVIGERRLRTLRDLSLLTTAETKSVEEVCRAAAQILSLNRHDLPFALIYLLDAGGSSARLVGASRLAEGSVAAPTSVDLTAAELGASSWPLRAVMRPDRVAEVTDLNARFGDLPSGVWPESTHTAVVLPIGIPGQDRASGFLVVGVSPRRPLDDPYRAFLDLLVNQISNTVASARAYEQEKRRAEALAELDRAKTLFFSNVSHEFRTPLTLMLGPLEDVLAGMGGSLPRETRERVDVAHRNSLRLLKLVNTLLDFSRIEAGRIQASYEPTDLCKLTVDLASVFRSAVERAGIRLVINCDELPEFVYVDREMWEKVVLNLLSNAFKFTFEGEIEVRLRAADGAAELAVRDTGIGIAAGEIPHLFERFHRVEGARGRTYEGTGIGLALVQELVRLHGGAVRVESVVGEGSSFIVRVPFGQTHLPAERIQAARSLASTALSADAYVEEALRWLPDESFGQSDGGATPADIFKPSRESPESQFEGQRPRILLADDNADMREYVRRLLSERYEVETAADGEAALGAARARTPDLVLTDVMMPRLDGFGLLKALREDPATSVVPVILLSARAGEESRVEGIEAGADDYLVKPFAARELLARVGTHLDLARARREEEERTAADLRAMRRLYEVGNLCSRAGHDFEQCLAEVVDTAVAITGADKGNLQLLDAESGALRIAAHRGFAEPFLKFFESVSLAEASVCGAALRSGVRVVVEDVTRSEIFAGQPSLGVLLEADVRAVQSVPLVSSSGEVLGMISTHFRQPHRPAERELRLIDLLARQAADYLERRRAEEALRESEHRFRTLFESMDEGFCVIEVIFDERQNPVDYRFLEINPVFEKQTGIKDAKGRLMREIAPEHEQHWFDIYGRIALTGETLRFENPAAALGRYYDVCAFRVGPAEQRRVGIVFNDITERRRAGEERERLLKRAQEARAAAEEASRLKDEFLATVSHELRTPLNAILGWANMLRRGMVDGGMSAHGLEVIERNARAQNQLIEDLLDVSRIITGKLRLDVQPVGLWEVIQAAADVVRPAADAKEIRLQLLLDPNAGPVSGDPQRLQQVVWNLLSNAVKFTPKGGCVQVRLERVNSHVEIAVSDTGDGIEADFLAHVFERFRQADGSYTRAHGGMGLGLAIVRHIVELHGGTVKAESEGTGRGATFTVTLPLLIVQDTGRFRPDAREREKTVAPPPASLDAPLPAGFEVPPRLDGLRLLLVEDEREALEMARLMLEECGAEVSAATSAAEGLRLLREQRPDVLVSDIEMPGEDGYALVGRVRSLPAREGGDTHCVALTAHARPEDRMRALAAGFDAHVAKPVEVAELAAVLAALARRRKA
jgi:signal transduction histidine kinase/DNA-binding response OmpR family regulator